MPVPAPRAEADARLDPHVQAEQVEALARTQGLALVLNVLLGVSAATILHLQRPDPRLWPWLALVVLVNLGRWALLYSAWVERAFGATPRWRLRLCTVGSAAVGLVWSALPAVLMDFRSAEAPFVAIILCGLTAGAALQGGAYAAPVAALSIPILLPMAGRLAALGTVSGGLVAFDILLYLGMILRSTRGAQAAFVKLAQLRWQTAGLAEDLQRQHDASQAAADRLFRLANHDPLTGAANRAAFARQLETWLARPAAADTGVSLLLIDLDHFKTINDTLGHGAGDEVLKAVAARLEELHADCGFVARLGGDEFAVLLSGEPDAQAQAGLAETLITRIREPLCVRGHPVNVGASIGLARYPQDAATGEELLARADLALYAAKAAGRQGWRRFEPALLSAAELARDIERDLPAALADGELQVWFQPQVEILTGRLTGFEALIRWRHPRLGWLPPPQIVAAASRLRLSHAFSRFVLARACTVLGRLDASGFGEAKVGVNISPLEMAHYDLQAMVMETLEAHRVDPGRLELEITEEAVLANDEAIATLASLRERGVRLAMDDFGTGNSSIAYLRKLRMDRMKIDRSFVVDLARSEGDRALVKAIVGMGRSLGVEVLAEGVETVEQSLLLHSLGCHLAQGYLYGAALSEADLAGYLAGQVRETQTRPRRRASSRSPAKQRRAGA